MASLHSLDDMHDLALETQLADEAIRLREIDQWPTADSECPHCGHLAHDLGFLSPSCPTCRFGAAA